MTNTTIDPTQPTTQRTEEVTTMSDSVPVAAIGGGIAAVVVIAIIVIITVVLLCRRSRRKNADRFNGSMNHIHEYQRGESRTEDNHGFENKNRPWRNKDIQNNRPKSLEMVEQYGISTICETSLPYPLKYPGNVTQSVYLGTGDVNQNEPGRGRNNSIGFEGYENGISYPDRRRSYDLQGPSVSVHNINDIDRRASLEHQSAQFISMHNVNKSATLGCSSNGLDVGFPEIGCKCLSANCLEHGQWAREPPPINPFYYKSAASSLGRDSGIGESQETFSQTDMSSLGSGALFSDGEKTPDSLTDNEMIIVPQTTSRLTSDRSVPIPKRTPMAPSLAVIRRQSKRQKTIQESDSEDAASHSDSDCKPRQIDLKDEECSDMFNLSDVDNEYEFDDFDPRAEMDRLLKDFKESYSESSTDTSNMGGCTKNFAAGYFCKDGGLLRLNDGSASVNIPPQSLKKRSLISMYAYYENYEENGRLYLRRVIECGPEGMNFERPVCVSFTPHLIDCSNRDTKFPEFEVLTSNNRISDEWRPLLERDAFWNAEPDQDLVTIHVTHFTRFTVSPKLSIQPVTDVQLRTGGFVEGAVGGCEPGTVRSNLTMYAFQKELASQGPAASLVRIYLYNDTGSNVNLSDEQRRCNELQRCNELRRYNEQNGYSCSLDRPRKMKTVITQSGLALEVINCHNCDVIGTKKHVIDYETVLNTEEEPDPREFRVKTLTVGADGSFEVAVFHDQKPGPVSVITLCVNHANFIDNFRKNSQTSGHLEYGDVLGYLLDSKILSFQFSSLLHKDLKLVVCNHAHDSWRILAERIGISPKKTDLISSYTDSKREMPCYIVLDALEAQYVKRQVNPEDAVAELTSHLSEMGFTRAADQVTVKARELNIIKPVHPPPAQAERSPREQVDNEVVRALPSQEMYHSRKQNVLNAPVRYSRYNANEYRDQNMNEQPDLSDGNQNTSVSSDVVSSKGNKANDKKKSEKSTKESVMLMNDTSIPRTDKKTNAPKTLPLTATTNGITHNKQIHDNTQHNQKQYNNNGSREKLTETLQTTGKVIDHRYSNGVVANSQQPFRHVTFGKDNHPNEHGDEPVQHRNPPLSGARTVNDSGIDSDTESQTPSSSSSSIFNSEISFLRPDHV